MKYYLTIILALSVVSHAILYENNNLISIKKIYDLNISKKMLKRFPKWRKPLPFVNFGEWRVCDDTPIGATVTNITDITKGKVTKLLGTRTLNSYALGARHGQRGAWNNRENRILTWSMKYNENFIVFVSLNTTKGHRYLLYSPESRDYGYSHGLGVDAKNGQWKNFTRNLIDDLHDVDADNDIITVDGFFIRGSGLIGDVTLLKRQKCYNHTIDDAVLREVSSLIESIDGPNVDGFTTRYEILNDFSLEQGNYFYFRVASSGVFHTQHNTIMRASCQDHSNVELVYAEEQYDFISKYIGRIDNVSYYSNYFDNESFHGVIGISDTLPVQKLPIGRGIRFATFTIMDRNFVVKDILNRKIDTYDIHGQLLSSESF